MRLQPLQDQLDELDKQCLPRSITLQLIQDQLNKLDTSCKNLSNEEKYKIYLTQAEIYYYFHDYTNAWDFLNSAEIKAGGSTEESQTLRGKLPRQAEPPPYKDTTTLALILISIILPIIPLVLTIYSLYYRMECHEEITPYETITKTSPLLDKDKEEVELSGIDEIREVCSNKTGDVEYKVLREGVDEVIIIGTREPIKITIPVPKNTYKIRIGAICEDGTYSNATGSGACSYHGGVSRWIYEYY
jgi:hypothetical protein